MSTNKENIINLIGIKELGNYRMLLYQLLAEFLGTFLFLALSLCAATNMSMGPLPTAFANGLLIASIIQVIGHVSGGHINPAVTFACMFYGEIKVVRALMYIVVQIVGAIAGAAIAYLLTESSYRGDLGVITPPQLLKIDQIFFLEFFQTFILSSVFCSVIDTKRGARGLGSAALAIGLTVTACNCSCLHYSSCLNPVRAFGPAVIMNMWSHHWVYWIAEMLGGIIAGIVYKILLVRRETSNEI